MNPENTTLEFNSPHSSLESVSEGEGLFDVEKSRARNEAIRHKVAEVFPDTEVPKVMSEALVAQAEDAAKRELNVATPEMHLYTLEAFEDALIGGVDMRNIVASSENPAYVVDSRDSSTVEEVMEELAARGDEGHIIERIAETIDDAAEAIEELQGHPVMQEGNGSGVEYMSPDDREEQLKAQELLEYAKSLLETADSTVELKELAKTIGNDTRIAETLGEMSRKEDANDWDRISIGLVLQEAANVRREANKKFSWSGESEYSDSEKKVIEQDTDAAGKIDALWSAVGVPENGRRILQKYGAMAGEGVDFADASLFDRFHQEPANTMAAITPEQVVSFSRQYNTLGENSKLYLANTLASTHVDANRVLRIDKYLNADKTDSLEERIEEIEQMARFLGVGLDEEIFNTRIAGVEMMGSRGVDARAVEGFFRRGETFGQFLASDIPEATIDLVAKLARHSDVDYGDTTLEGPSNVLQGLMNSPDEFRAAVELIDNRVDDVVRSDYPPRFVFDAIQFEFGPYGINNLKADVTVEEWHAKRLEHLFDAMQAVGDSTLELGRLASGGMEPAADYLLSGIMDAMESEPDYDITAAKMDMVDIAERLRILSQDQPDMYEAMLRSGGLQEASLNAIDARVRLVAGLEPHLPFLLGLKGQSAQSIFSRLDRSAVYSAGGVSFSDGLYDSIKELQVVVQENPQLDQVRLANEFIGYSDADGSRHLREFLTSDLVGEVSKDERMLEQIDYALFEMRSKLGKFDFDRDVSLLQSIGDVPQGYLSSVIRTEGSLGSSSVRVMFHDVALRTLVKRDQHGNLYDAPEMLGRIVAENGESAEGRLELDWFVNADESLPIAAFDSVRYFHRQEKEGEMGGATPRQLYEWIHKDPNKVAELSQYYVKEYVNKLAIPDTVNIDELIEQAGELADKQAEDFRVFVNIQPDALQTVIDNGGAIRSTFELNGLRVNGDGAAAYNSDYMLKRSGVEVALGIRALDNDDAHPVYGSCGFVGDGVPSGAIGYGNVMLSYKLDDELAAQTSYTPEDSFHGAHQLTERDARIVRIIKTGLGQGHMRTNEYVEAQVSGGLDVDKVDAVYVPSEEALQALPLFLQARAILRPLSDSVDTYSGSRERTLFSGSSL